MPVMNRQHKIFKPSVQLLAADDKLVKQAVLACQSFGGVRHSGPGVPGPAADGACPQESRL